jgi:hypothetical protein
MVFSSKFQHGAARQAATSFAPSAAKSTAETRTQNGRRDGRWDEEVMLSHVTTMSELIEKGAGTIFVTFLYGSHRKERVVQKEDGVVLGAEK